MALSSRAAKQLCTKSELELFSESLAKNVRKLDAKALRSRVGRARKLRDKYRHKADRQDREARGKQAPRRSRPSQGSAQTRKKEQLFAEVLDRFEKQLTALASPQASPKTGATRPRRTAAAAAKRSAPGKTAAKTSQRGHRRPAVTKKKATRKTRSKSAVVPEDALDPRSSAAITRARTTARQARTKAAGRVRVDKHLAAQNRRRQARRDAR
jgi:hypothetical protein